MHTSPLPPHSRHLARFVCIIGLVAASFLPKAHASTLTISQTFGQNWVKIAQNNTTVTPTYPTEDTTGDDGMGYPRAYLFQVENGGVMAKKILLKWQTNPDIGWFPQVHGWSGSTNGGVTWNVPTPTSPSDTNPDMMILVRRVTDAKLVAIQFYPNNETTPTTSFSFPYHTSTNNGVSWTKSTNGLISFGAQTMAGGYGFRFWRGAIQDNDGTLYATAYATYTVGENHRIVLMRSTDGGVNWHLRGTIKYEPKPASDYNEANVVRCANGSMLAVVRQELNPLRYARSTDNGLNWTTVATLPGLAANEGVDPYLWLMPNGILTLNYGHTTYFGALPKADHPEDRHKHKRDGRLAFSLDGNGTSWSTSDEIEVFTANPTPPAWQQNSTGYMSVVPLSSHRLMMFSDRAEKTYYYTNSQMSPNPFSIWTKVVDIEPNLKNRIDLKGLYAAVGAGMVTGDLTYSNATFPEARPSGAFDSTTDYWSGAFKTGTSGTYTIDLQETRTLNAVGICLQYATTQSATVAISTNGSTWTTVKTYSNAKHWAMDYTSFTAAPARYVRVTMTGATARVGLNEIELYETSDTFENNAQYLLPTVYTATNGGFSVTGAVGYGYRSERVLYMNDADTTYKTATKTTTATTSKTLDFWVKPLTYAASSGAIQFHIMSGASSVYHMAIWSDGSVNYYTTGWNQVGSGGAGTVSPNTWTHIRVVATISPATATVYINGSSIGTAAKKTGTTMNGFLFGSGGSTPTGDTAFFDDVFFN